MAKIKEDKIVLERLYTIPLRREFLKVPRYRRATKAVKALKQFLVKHMKVYDRDLKKIKVDIHLNNELRFRGIKNPPTRIKVLARKFESGIVRAELSVVPQIVKYRIAREEKMKTETLKSKKEKEEVKKKAEKAKEEAKTEETKEEKEVKEEKKEAVREFGLERAVKQAKEIKHKVQQTKEPRHQKRVALQK